MNTWSTKIKTKITDSNSLSLVYTPGVGACCLKIKEDKNAINTLTNRSNSIAVFAFSDDDFLSAQQKSVEYKKNKNIDAYPIFFNSDSKELFIKTLKAMVPSFYGYDLTIINADISNQIESELKDFDLQIKYSHLKNNNEFKGIKSSTVDINDYVDNGKTVNENSVELHKQLKGVIEVSVEKNNQNIIENTVAVISDGSAVLGLGNIGAYAALPVMEGKCALLKSLAGINGVSICLDTQDNDELVEIISAISPSFGAINLEDIGAPRCFEIEERVIKNTDIPIFHDDQHGTAVIVSAGFRNALKLVKKDIKEVKVIMSGAGAAAQAVAKLLLHNGVKNLILSDIDGAVYKGREQNDFYLNNMAQKTNPYGLKSNLKEIIKDADVFIGLSAPNILTTEMIKSMNDNPIIFALANPVPEVMPDVAKRAGAHIIATGRSDFKNQINNSLAFPGIFKGTLKAKASSITDNMKLAASKAIADLITDTELSPDYIIPHALDERVANAVSKAVYECAVK